MSGGEDWLLRPWARGLCDYKDIKNGEIDLVDVYIMNEALDVMDENDRRMSERDK